MKVKENCKKMKILESGNSKILRILKSKQLGKSKSHNWKAENLKK